MAQAQADLAQKGGAGQAGGGTPVLLGSGKPDTQKKSIGYTATGSFAKANASAGLINALV
jgi:hypothetical protein